MKAMFFLLGLFVSTAGCATPSAADVPSQPKGASTTGAAAGAKAGTTAPLVNPGSKDHPMKLRTALAKAWAQRPTNYVPRTRHLHPDGAPKYINRLFLQTSPYLRQHAHNPVDWRPWGDAAFAEAQAAGLPVLLSIGYSTCHWCHVMEEESFEDVEIATIINANYIPIKVDREERPDVDSIYMVAAQMMTGGGGWPMTMWLTPDRRPYFGGTYFPARDGERGVRHGFLTLLKRLKTVFDTQKEDVEISAGQLAKGIRQQLEAEIPPAPFDAAAVLKTAITYYKNNFDETWGGLRRARNKFPSSLPIRLLLRYHHRTGDTKVLEMATFTLRRMAAGGMRDQVAGGFHRYSTDARWLVPHFEKMVYDNALLTLAYLDAYQATGDPQFAAIARDTLRYVARDMTAPKGGFFSATDADSLNLEGHRDEGFYFTWTPAELTQVLGAGDARVVMAVYAVTPKGNFEGRSILHQPRPLDVVATELGLDRAALDAKIELIREALYIARNLRPAPIRDEKILVSWNGLMIAAFAQGAMVLQDPKLADIARAAADRILNSMRRGKRLVRSALGGQLGGPAFLDDYAFLIAGLIDLFEATGEGRYLDAALELDGVLAEHFEDPKGGYYTTGSDHEVLLAREKPSDDGAEPSGNSVQALNLARLHELTTDDRYRQRLERLLLSFSGTLAKAPMTLSELLLAVDFQHDTAKEVVLSSSRSGGSDGFLKVMAQTFVPNRVLIRVTGTPSKAAQKRTPLVEGKVPLDGAATAYVCENGVCARPTHDLAQFKSLLLKRRMLD